MRAALDNAAMIEHEDFVGVDDGREAVRNDQCRAIARDFGELGLDHFLGACVECAGGFVKHQNRRILEQRACDRHALLFATREFQTALAYAGVVALRQTLDEIMDMRCARRGDHLLARCLRFAVGDVVVNRVVEQHRVLRHDADRRAQRFLRDFADVLSVDRDAPRIDIVEAVQQTRQRRLARTGGADHGDGFPGWDGKIHVVQNAALWTIAERNLIETHRAASDGHRLGTGRIAHLLRLGQETEHALDIGQRLFHFAIHHAEIVQRHRQLDQKGVDEHQIAERHASGNDAVRGTPQQQS